MIVIGAFTEKMLKNSCSIGGQPSLESRSICCKTWARKRRVYSIEYLEKRARVLVSEGWKKPTPPIASSTLPQSRYELRVEVAQLEVW